jgi:hypothetical protein
MNRLRILSAAFFAPDVELPLSAWLASGHICLPNRPPGAFGAFPIFVELSHGR